LDESEDEFSEKLGYSPMAKDFDRLFNHLHQEGYLDKEYEHRDENEPC
jgi:hypothetical protein